TVAGTGQQLRTTADAEAGALSSPWDVTLLDDTLYVAMAGSHQIYSVRTDGTELRVHTGNRREALGDGPLGEATLAQPMAITAHARTLYFADAETSAIRIADVARDGEVRTIVGTGLFDFGNRDGVSDEVRLEHPQGLSRMSDGRLLIADSYNDALKWLDPATRRVTTWVRGFAEPGAVVCGERFAYVADTNAHRVCAVDYATGDVRDVTIALSEP
ncbi:MAG TPA: alkyl hydroperoxide reductase, partial [Candidatus Elarobacter sp.]|nr:alkyl hydroperoxide reductase [Candidatus Elarobacter sp.]